MKLKILLITVYTNTSEVMFEELGVCSIATVLRENGYQVMLVCAREDDIDYKKIKDFNPGMVGVTVYSYNKQSVYHFCTRVREELPGIFICAGGYLPTYFGPQMMKEAPFIDFAIRGEGEISFLNLLSHLEKGEDLQVVRGLIYRREGQIKVNEDQPLLESLNSLPFPARDILFDNKLKIASISTSRGCARRCRFCNTANFWKKWRGREVPAVLREIKELYNKGIRYFSFNDSSFEDSDAHFDRIMELVQGLKDLNANRDISYIAGFRAEFNRNATPGLMELLKKSGLRQVRIGIETANPFDRKLYGKWATLEDNHKIIRHFQDHNIYVRVGFINFNPYSTFEGLRKNIRFLEDCGWAGNFYTVASRLTVYKGTDLYNKVKGDGLMINEDSDSPQCRFIDKRIMNTLNYIQSYFYLANTETSGAPAKICNYKNYFQSIVYDFFERFGNNGNGRASQLVSGFEKEIKGILSDVNQRNARWFRELLDLAETGWDNKKAYQIMSASLDKEYLTRTVNHLETKKQSFSSELQALDPEYKTWVLQTWNTIGNLKL